jgi:hypothetical protein
MSTINQSQPEEMCVCGHPKLNHWASGCHFLPERGLRCSCRTYRPLAPEKRCGICGSTLPHGQPSMTDHNEPPLPNYCAFCETELFGDNDADMLREHLKVCDKHPMKALLSLAERMNDAAIYHLEMHNPVSNIILRQRIAEFEAWKEKGK